MNVRHFFDPQTFTLTYVAHDERSRDAVIVDPVLDYEPGASKVSTASVDAVLEFVRGAGLKVHWVLETHAHADHLSAAQVLRRRLDAKTAIGERITEVQRIFRDVFDLQELRTDGSQFDRLLRDGETFAAGSLRIEVLATPGHTPACLSYRIDDAVFTGDALFVEDYGTGRTDFPGGSADDLYASVHERLYALPDETRVFVGHDYLPNGRPLRFETTIGASKRANVHVRAETSRESFVALRRTRDATLAAPRLLLPSVQVNIAGGRMPKKHANGRRYLALPIQAPAELDEEPRLARVYAVAGGSEK
jgi:glyoxylase-like metal-dependent hydrolase (beta-lactamase superfamily II)